MNYQELLSVAIEAAIKAGEKIMTFYNADYPIEIKSDESPVTIADKSAEEIIISYLKRTLLPIISEEHENTSYEQRKEWNFCWVVDPLDGTKEFIHKNGEFTVNIALVENQMPVIGVIYSPAGNDLFFASKDMGSFKTKVRSGNIDAPSLQKLPLKNSSSPVVIAVSRSHSNEKTEAFVNAFREKYPDLKTLASGSSMKMCRVAEGEAHLYPRFGRTMEWDTAAGHAILSFANASLLNIGNMQELKYNKEDLSNPDFIAMSNNLKL